MNKQSTILPKQKLDIRCQDISDHTDYNFLTQNLTEQYHITTNVSNKSWHKIAAFLKHSRNLQHYTKLEVFLPKI